MTADKARNQIEPLLRNKKKAEEIIKKQGNPATLDAAATASGQTIQHADSVLFVRPYVGQSQEGKVAGAAFDKSLAGKPVSPAIPGNSGVYFIKVENVSAMSNPNADPSQQTFMMEQQQKYLITNQLAPALQKLAVIKDYRGKFF